MKSWEQLDGETPEAFESFKSYRDGGTERSLIKTSVAIGKSLTLMERWSSKHGWVQRARDFDRMMDRATLDALLQGRAKMVERHAGIALKLQARVLAKINNMTDAEIKAMPIEKAVRIFDVASRIEAAARGKDADATTDQPIRVTVNTFMNGEQIAELKKEMTGSGE